MSDDFRPYETHTAREISELVDKDIKFAMTIEAEVREALPIVILQRETALARIAALEAQLEAARKDVEKLRALYRAMREPMAMIGMDKHIGPFSDEAIALLDAMNALDGGTYSKSEGS